MTIGPRRRTPLGGRMNRGFGAGFTFSGLATSGFATFAAFAAFAAFSFFGLAAFSFFVGIAGASTVCAVGVGMAEASGGSGGGGSRFRVSGFRGGYCLLWGCGRF